MKFLLLFFIFMVIAFQWRQARKPKVRKAARKSTPASAMDMPACAHCGIHFPATEAVTGRDGVYCSLAHRQIREP